LAAVSQALEIVTLCSGLCSIWYYQIPSCVKTFVPAVTVWPTFDHGETGAISRQSLSILFDFG